MNSDAVIWQPNPGPQTRFLKSPAREVLFGGAAGGGKTDGLLMAAVSQVQNTAHRALIVRRSFPQLRDLIERSHELFMPLGAIYTRQERLYRYSPRGNLAKDKDRDRL